MELFDTTVTEELFELTRDGYTYSVDVEADCVIEAWRSRGDWDNPPE